MTSKSVVGKKEQRPLVSKQYGEGRKSSRHVQMYGSTAR